MNEEIRKVENYEIINSMHIGDKEIVIGIDMNNAEGLYYMVADCERNELFERYDNALVSDSYIDIAEIYSDRLKEQIEKLKASEINIPQGIITPDMCDSINGKDLEEQIIVIKADVLRPEYRTQAHQIVRCKGGNGSYANARGSAVFCNCFWDDKSTRFERQDVQGILNSIYYPDWLKEKLDYQQELNKDITFEYGGYHFTPVGIVKHTPYAFAVGKHISTDKTLSIWSKNYNEIFGQGKIDYTHNDFYKAARDVHCDVFKCIENGKKYIPGEHELFEYKGGYAAFDEKELNKTKANKEMER